MNSNAGMSLIVKTVTRITVGLILIYGIYIVLQGHIGPGGGFAGGVIIALSFIHLILAFGRKAVFKAMNEERGAILAGAGGLAVLFSLIFIRNMLVNDLAIALLVSGALFTVFITLIGLASKEKQV